MKWDDFHHFCRIQAMEGGQNFYFNTKCDVEGTLNEIK